MANVRFGSVADIRRRILLAGIRHRPEANPSGLTDSLFEFYSTQNGANHESSYADANELSYEDAQPTHVEGQSSCPATSAEQFARQETDYVKP